MNLFLVGEGEGELAALPKLVSKLRNARPDLAALPWVHEDRVARMPLNPGMNGAQERVVKVCEKHRQRDRVAAMLLTSDCEDNCPRDLAPEIAGWVRPLGLPFPVAVLLFYREYETQFLAASECLSGKQLPGAAVARPGLPSGSSYEKDPESERDAKKWLGQMMGRPYKPALDQASFTALLDVDDPGLRRLSSFRRLENALRFLAHHAGTGEHGKVYP